MFFFFLCHFKWCATLIMRPKIIPKVRPHGQKNSIKIKTSEKILQNRHQEWRLMWSSNRSNLNSLFQKNPCIALLPNNLYSIRPYSLKSYMIIFLETIWTSKLNGLFQKNNWMLVEIPKQLKTKCQIPPKDSHPTNKCIIDFYFP